ncbi:MAG: phosphotransferase [Solirubrobacteraceae bacterium]
MDVPRAPAEITPEWMTEILIPRIPGVRVEAVDLGDLDEGTTVRVAARLAYSAGQGPERVFIKAQGPLGHRLLLASTGTLFGEARVLAHRDLLPLEVPEVYGSRIERRTLRTITVMEDVTARGATQNAATDPLTPDQAADGLAGLASLHGRYWSRPLPEQLAWAKRWRMGPGYVLFAAVGPRKSVLRLKALGKHELMPKVSWSSGYSLKLFRRSCELARTGPQTLLHGDAHVGNTYRLAERRIGFYDWQFIRTGSWAHDVGYFLVSALRPEDRRCHERELLRGYLNGLRAAGAGSSVPSEDQAWERYRQTPAYGLVIWLGTHGFDEYQTEEICLATIERFARAFDELRTDAAIS